MAGDERGKSPEYTSSRKNLAIAHAARRSGGSGFGVTGSARVTASIMFTPPIGSRLPTRHGGVSKRLPPLIRSVWTSAQHRSRVRGKKRFVRQAGGELIHIEGPIQAGVKLVGIGEQTDLESLAGK
jgi:hypothetical protein